MTATNKDVIATINPFLVDIEGQKYNVEVINTKNSLKHTFTENAEFTFQYAEVGINEVERDVREHTAVVSWIDKIVPTAEIKYSTKESTDGPVTATLVDESEDITITNNGGSREYTFDKNGKFTFEFVDKAGNNGTVEATVSWIKEEQKEPDNPEVPDAPKQPEGPSEPGKPEESSKYQLSDINGDGKITATDLLLLKRHLVAGKKKDWVLTGDKFKAADINEDGKITATDLLLMKRLVLKEMKK